MLISLINNKFVVYSSIKEYFKSNITSPIRQTNTVYVKNSPHKFVRRCKYRLMIF